MVPLNTGSTLVAASRSLQSANRLTCASSRNILARAFPSPIILAGFACSSSRANATFAFSLLLSFDNFQHIWLDFFAELSTFRESSTNNVCISNYSLIQISSCCPATSFVSFSMKVFKPVKICLKNRYSEEQIHWVPLIHLSFSIFFFRLRGMCRREGHYIL